MISRRAIGNTIGILSLTCSLAFWVLFFVGRIIGHYPAGLDMPFNCWALAWALGFLFALTAALLGSRWWAFASILPVVSFFLVIHIVRSVPF